MADASNGVGLIVSVGSAIVSGLAILAFWMKLSDRITVADRKADAALQEAAEAKEENHRLREAFDDMTRDIADQLERMRRENGENVAAIRQHVTEVAFFGRDNFARKDDIAAAMTKIEAVHIRMDTKLDNISQQIRDGN